MSLNASVVGAPTVTVTTLSACTGLPTIPPTVSLLKSQPFCNRVNYVKRNAERDCISTETSDQYRAGAF